MISLEKPNLHARPDKIYMRCPDKIAETKCIFSFRRNTSRDGADVMSSGRVFQSLGPATANDRSPTVTSRDRGMAGSEEVDDRRQRLDVSLKIIINQIFTAPYGRKTRYLVYMHTTL